MFDFLKKLFKRKEIVKLETSQGYSSREQWREEYEKHEQLREQLKTVSTLRERDIIEHKIYGGPWHYVREDRWYNSANWYYEMPHIDNRHRIVINMYAFDDQNEKFYYPICNGWYPEIHETSFGITSLEGRTPLCSVPLRYELKAWLNDNVGKGMWTVKPVNDCIVFGFNSSDHAMLFRMTWC